MSPYFTHPLVLALWSVAIATFAIFSMLTLSNIATYRVLRQPALRIYTGFTALGALLACCIVLSLVPMPPVLKSHVFRLMWVFGPIGLSFWVWSVVTFADCNTRTLHWLSLGFTAIGAVAFLDLALCAATGASGLYSLAPESTEAVALLASGNVLRHRPFANLLGLVLIVLALVTSAVMLLALLRTRRIDLSLIAGVILTPVLVCTELVLVITKSKYSVPLVFLANVVEAVRISWASRERLFSELNEIRLAQREQAALLETQLQQLQLNAEMAKLGQHTAELSHDLRNPLTTVIGTLDLAEAALAHKPSQVDDALELLSSMRLALDHILELVRSITYHARDSQPALAPVSLPRIVSNALALCQHRLHQVTVNLELGRDELWVLGRQTELVQVLVNLLVNACDALRGHEKPWLLIAARSTDKGLQVRITDAGKRPPDTLLDKMFTTRFTTNSTEASTGLGLTICAQIVRQHNGEISIDRKSPNTTIVVELPRANGAARNAA